MEIAGFFAHVFVSNAATLGTCLFWALIGLAVMSPLLLAESLYRSYQIRDVYQFGEAYHLVRQQYKRDTLIFSMIFGVTILMILVVLAL